MRVTHLQTSFFWLLCTFIVKTTATILVNPSELYLCPSFNITSVPRTRNYDWTVSNQTAAPDGYSRNVLVINSQLPGPLIEVNEGDTLNIKVTNMLSKPLTIHWHGISQNGSAWMDGVTGVTQCPIPVGKSFVYTFTIQNQYGTFWYHAHTQNFNADGISGPLIVHSVKDPLKRGVDFDQDVILFITDWYHNVSQTIVGGLLSPTGYNNTYAAPSPNSALINGIGYFNCSFAEPNAKCTTPTTSLSIDLPTKKKTRFRLIGAGAHALFRFSVDNHTLNVTEADATGVSGPPAVHRIPFHNGERYSVIIDTSADQVGSTFYLRAAMDLDCFAWVAPGLVGQARTALGVIRIVDSSNHTSINTTSVVPTTKDWLDTLGGACVDLDVSTISPLVRRDACTNVLGRAYYSSSFGTVTTTANNVTSVTGRFFVNGTTWLTHPYRPLLSQLLSGGQGSFNSSEVAAFTLETSGCYDIVINNLDAAIDHSYHLHGVDGWIVATGSGQLNTSTVGGLRYNTTNPLRRDTQVVPGGSYHVVRVLANNPGVWILHCHLGWHLAGGFAGMIVMQPSVLRQQKWPAANQALCDGVSPADLNSIDPGRMRRSVDQYYSDLSS